MADYYSILNKTISGLANNSQETRTAIYGKARTAIERQLRAMNPVPSEDAIARQMQLLEAAIVKLDTEYGSRDAPSPSQQKVSPAPAAARTPQPPQQPPLRAPVSQPVKQPATASVVASGNLSVNKSHESVPPAVNVDNTPVTQHSAVANEHVSVDPRGMEYDETILAAVPDTRSVNQKDEQPKKGGFLSALIPILLAFGVVGGGLYALWINKDALIDGLMGANSEPTIQSSEKDSSEKVSSDSDNNITDTKSQVDANDNKKVRIVGEDTTEKNSSKLTPEGETIKVEPELPKDDASIQTPVDTGVTSDQNNGQTAENSNSADQKVVELGEDGQPKPIDEQAANNNSNVAAENSSNENTDQVRAVEATPSVAQKAFLYEEGTAGASASRDNAAIIWSMEQELLDDGNRDAVIKGHLEVPGRELSMTLLIKRNRDESLPASHIIELQFQLPKDFSGNNISDVSRFVMKTSEQGRGEGLIAVPAKISDGNFLIALNNLEQALATNNKLMLESSWIDVPLGYTTGRRALVTLEKGALGDKVFRDAFAEWAKK